MKPPLVVYHGGCRDGWCAAWVASRYLLGRDGTHPELFAGYFGQAPPEDIDGREVYILDFSYTRDVLDDMHRRAGRLLVLDHHKTAQEALSARSYALFDMKRSGAGMAWDFFYAATPRPALVNYVEDRDLWLHKLPDSHVFNAYLATLPFTYEAWEQAHITEYQDTCETGNPLSYGISLGRGAIKKTEQYVREMAKNARAVNFDDHPRVWLVNAAQIDVSELLHHLCGVAIDGALPMFAMAWFQRGDGMFQYGLRSVGEFDVSLVARRFGGGGHKNAAGFQVAAKVHEVIP